MDSSQCELILTIFRYILEFHYDGEFEYGQLMSCPYINTI